MERIILEVNEATALRWNALSNEQRKDLTLWFEQLFLQLLADEEAATQTVGEPDTIYKTAGEPRQRKVRKKPLTPEDMDEIRTLWGYARPTEVEVQKVLNWRRKHGAAYEASLEAMGRKAEASGLTAEILADILEWDDDTFENLIGYKRKRE